MADPELSGEVPNPYWSRVNPFEGIEPNAFLGKVILITGAGSKIGRATSIKLSHLGAFLALCDIDAAALLRTRDSCFDRPDGVMRIFTRAFDIASSAPCISFIAEVIKHLGHIDHVFNWPTMNPAPLQLATITDEHWDRLVNTNLKGLFNITRACIPHLEAGTSFVNASFAASSIAGLSYPTASLAVYNASVIGFSKFMASEFSPRGIRTNILVLSFPDPVLTNMGLPEDTQNVSSERPKQPGEIAAVVCSFMEDGGSQTNGHLFEITGGVA